MQGLPWLGHVGAISERDGDPHISVSTGFEEEVCWVRCDNLAVGWLLTPTHDFMWKELLRSFIKPSSYRQDPE